VAFTVLEVLGLLKALGKGAYSRSSFLMLLHVAGSVPVIWLPGRLLKQRAQSDQGARGED
jgi:hypothetical protein